MEKTQPQKLKGFSENKLKDSVVELYATLIRFEDLKFYSDSVTENFMNPLFDGRDREVSDHLSAYSINDLTGTYADMIMQIKNMFSDILYQIENNLATINKRL